MSVLEYDNCSTRDDSTSLSVTSNHVRLVRCQDLSIPPCLRYSMFYAEKRLAYRCDQANRLYQVLLFMCMNHVVLIDIYRKPSRVITYIRAIETCSKQLALEIWVSTNFFPLLFHDVTGWTFEIGVCSIICLECIVQCHWGRQNHVSWIIEGLNRVQQNSNNRRLMSRPHFQFLEVK